LKTLFESMKGWLMRFIARLVEAALGGAVIVAVLAALVLAAIYLAGG